MRKKNLKRTLSLFVIMMMLFGVIWQTPAMAGVPNLSNGKANISSVDNKFQEKKLSNVALAKNKFTVSKSQITAKLSEQKTKLKTDEIKYVNQLAESLKTPIGAIGFKNLNSTELQSVIVQFDVLPSIILKEYNTLHKINGIDSEKVAKVALTKFKASVKSAGISPKFGYDFHNVFNGVALKLPANQIEKLAKMPGVYSVSPDYMMHQTITTDSTYSDESGVGMKESRELLRTAELNDKGFTGAGVKVGVLDTGIDYNHPDLKGNYKGGHDYIGAAVATPDADGNISYLVPCSEDNDPMETTYEDWQKASAAHGETLVPEVNAKGSEYYTSHGTHVSGTVAANAKNSAAAFRTLGIAPKADLYVYRVLGPYGSGPDSGIIAAVEQAVKDEMKVINLSLGSNEDTAYTADAFALNNACIAGTIVCVSAGNNAMPTGATSRKGLSLGTPGTAYLPITVAASNYGGGATKFYLDAIAGSVAVPFSVVGQDVNNVFENNSITAQNLTYVDGLGYKYTLVAGALNGEALAPTALAQLETLAAGSLQGQILVVKRGAMNFTDMLAQAKRTSAGALLIINKDAEAGYISGITIGGENQNHMPVLSTTKVAGVKLAQAMAASEPAYIKIGNLSKIQLPKTPASFSSIGPVTETIGIKPDIIAPGVDILSTQPAFIMNPDHNTTDFTYAYARMGGTSMSCPHMTGISVLMRQAFPTASVAEIKARLMNTADPTLIGSGVDATPQASVFEVGAGFVNPYRAIVSDTSTFVTVQDDIPGRYPNEVIANQALSSLNFGTVTPSDAVENSRKLTVTIHNTSASAQSYQITGVYNDKTGYSRSSADGVGMSFSKNSVSVPAGGTGTFDANTTIPANCPNGLFEGYVHVTSAANDYVLPFAFATGGGATPFEILDAWMIKPVITANNVQNGAFSTLSNTSPFAMAYEGNYPGGKMDVLLLDMNEEIIGYYGTYEGMGESDGSTGLYADAITYECYPVDATGHIGKNLVTIPEGAYKVAFADSENYYTFGGLVVDNQRPVLTLNPGPNYEYKNGETIVHITGRIYSHAGEVLVANNITSDNLIGSPLYGQQLNALVLGNTAYRYCDENGYFDIPLTAAEASKAGISSLNSFAMDYYATTYYFGSDDQIYSTKTGNNVASDEPVVKYSQSPVLSAVNASNGSVTATLSYDPRLIAPKQDDFKVKYAINGGTPQNLVTTGFNYAAPAANLIFAPIAETAEDQSVVVSVTYKEVTVSAAAFVIPAKISKDQAKLTVYFSEAGTVPGWTNGQSKNFMLGSGVELKAMANEGNVFLYWKDEKGRVVSTSPQCNFSIGGATKLTAVFADAASKKVTFVVSGEVVLISTFIGTQAPVFPENPFRPRYTFSGWDKTPGEINQANSDAVVNAIFVKNEKQNTVTLTGGTFETGKATESTGPNTLTAAYATGDLATVTPAAIDGQIFAGWMNQSGKVVCYDPIFTFHVMADMALTATYQPEGKPLEKTSIIMIDSWNKAENKVNVVSYRNIPQGYSVVSHGIVYTSSALSATNDSFVLGGMNVSKATAKTTGLVGKFEVSINPKNNGQAIYVRAFVTVKDMSGKTEILYSDITTIN